MPRFQVFPDEWRGVRNNLSSLVIDYKEWSDSKNVDARFGWSSAGLTLVENLDNITARQVRSLNYFYDTQGVLHRLATTDEGKVYQDGANQAAVSVPTVAGYLANVEAGLGGAVLARGTSLAPIWRDPADGTWKVLAATSGTVPKPNVVAIDPAGPRLFTAPGTLGPDSFQYSAVGDFKKWAAADGAGEDVVAEDREPISAMCWGLGANMALYKRHKIFVRTGTTPSTWVIHPVSQDIGSVSPCVIRVAKGQFFIHESGAYFVNAVGQVSFPALTQKIQDTWDAMVASYGDYLPYAHAAYHPLENTVYLWVPNAASRVMGRLIKIYVPTGAVTLHDDKPALCSAYRPSWPQYVTLGDAASRVYSVSGASNDGATISSQVTTGVFSGNPPTPELEKTWGFGRGVIQVFLQARGSNITVNCTPTIYQLNRTVTGTAQALALTAGQITKADVYLPDAMGWGFSLGFAATHGSGNWRLLGYAGNYEEHTDA